MGMAVTQQKNNRLIVLTEGIFETSFQLVVFSELHASHRNKVSDEIVKVQTNRQLRLRVEEVNVFVTPLLSPYASDVQMFSSSRLLRISTS